MIVTEKDARGVSAGDVRYVRNFRYGAKEEQWLYQLGGKGYTEGGKWVPEDALRRISEGESAGNVKGMGRR